MHVSELIQSSFRTRLECKTQSDGHISVWTSRTTADSDRSDSYVKRSLSPRPFPGYADSEGTHAVYVAVESKQYATIAVDSSTRSYALSDGKYPNHADR